MSKDIKKYLKKLDLETSFISDNMRVEGRELLTRTELVAKAEAQESLGMVRDDNEGTLARAKSVSHAGDAGSGIELSRKNKDATLVSLAELVKQKQLEVARARATNQELKRELM